MIPSSISITLWGMALVPRHGMESHLVRPDRVYGTSIWTPIVGFQPTSNAMSVAAQFVQDRGLAGHGLFRRKQAQRTFRGAWLGPTSGHGRAPGFGGSGLGFLGGFMDWIRNLLAGLKARLMIYKIQSQLVAGGKTTVVEVDTSPRKSYGGQIVDAVRGLLPMPSLTSPQASANALSNQLTVQAAAPTVLPGQAAYVVAPGAADMTVALSNAWRQGY